MYWTAQISGWLIYLSFVLIYNLFGDKFTWGALVSTLLILLVGIPVTHLFRFIILKLDWLRYSLLQAIPRILFGSFCLSILFMTLHDLLTQIFVPRLASFFELEFVDILQTLLNWTLVLVFWSILYFTAHYFFNYRRQEILNIQLEASRNEIELSNLKSQLNPHFMFNALNGIRALVDEEPEKAKKSITQLSVLLRASLGTGKSKTIKLKDELNLVENYLSLEKMRFEDRLQMEFDIDPSARDLNIPPLMLQTIVENAVKHGISSLPKGGIVKVEAKEEESAFAIKVWNSGKLIEKTEGQGGIGLSNTKRRLGLIYGNSASLSIENKNNLVLTQIRIPKS